MNKPLYLAQVTYRNKRLDVIDKAIVGIFSTLENAQKAIEDVVEGTLSVSFDAEILSTSVDEFDLDKSVENPDMVPEDDIPF